jgi:farnesyl-diphosphate farnesyltransferase
MEKPASESDLLTGLLRGVSRSFYLSLRLLPAAVRPPVSLAYLLARTSDTIADAGHASVEERLAALAAFRRRIRCVSRESLDFQSLAASQRHLWERQLLLRVEESLSALESSEPADCQYIRQVLEIIMSGQELDLRRFAEAGPGRIVALQTDDELDDYTYRVAGCVGEFWTRICRKHLFPDKQCDETQLLADGVCFGKGLQMVNILRDLPRDLRQGRCYIPAGRLAEVGLQPVDLLDSANETRFRPLYRQYLGQARNDLQIGWRYTNALPWKLARLRWACALPIFLGIKTLAKLEKNPILFPDLRMKVSRAELCGLILRMVIWYPWPKAWQEIPRRWLESGGEK